MRAAAASRIIMATPRTLFRTFLDHETMLAWRVPAGAQGSFSVFDPRIGGGYCLNIHHRKGGSPGWSAPGVDIVEGRFVDLVPDRLAVEELRFVTEDMRFAGTMVATTTLEPVNGGTKATVRTTGLPDGISPDEHHAALTSALRQLAMLTE